jgi:cyclic beta-1,2-glucan synthetase
MLVLDPCIPCMWPAFELEFRHRSARYQVAVENPRAVSRGITRLELDGEALRPDGAGVPLADDGAVHRVRVVLG